MVNDAGLEDRLLQLVIGDAELVKSLKHLKCRPSDFPDAYENLFGSFPLLEGVSYVIGALLVKEEAEAAVRQNEDESRTRLQNTIDGAVQRIGRVKPLLEGCRVLQNDTRLRINGIIDAAEKIRKTSQDAIDNLKYLIQEKREKVLRPAQQLLMYGLKVLEDNVCGIDDAVRQCLGSSEIVPVQERPVISKEILNLLHRKYKNLLGEPVPDAMPVRANRQSGYAGIARGLVAVLAIGTASVLWYLNLRPDTAVPEKKHTPVPVKYVSVPVDTLTMGGEEYLVCGFVSDCEIHSFMLRCMHAPVIVDPAFHSIECPYRSLPQNITRQTLGSQKCLYPECSLKKALVLYSVKDGLHAVFPCFPTKEIADGKPDITLLHRDEPPTRFDINQMTGEVYRLFTEKEAMAAKDGK